MQVVLQWPQILVAVWLAMTYIRRVVNMPREIEKWDYICELIGYTLGLLMTFFILYAGGFWTK